MADQPVPSLARAREQKISELSNYFANDDLTLDELERRIERVYKAGSVADLEAITSDLRAAMAAPLVAPGASPPRKSIAPLSSPASLARAGDAMAGRIRAIMSSTRRAGRWLVPRRLDVLAVMSDTKLDMTAAAIPPGVIDIDMRVVMASFKLIVPPNVRVINEMHAFMADVSSRADEMLPGDVVDESMPIIRLTGKAIMSDVKVVVRRKEDAAYYNDDEDDD